MSRRFFRLEFADLDEYGIELELRDDRVSFEAVVPPDTNPNDLMTAFAQQTEAAHPHYFCTSRFKTFVEREGLTGLTFRANGSLYEVAITGLQGEHDFFAIESVMHASQATAAALEKDDFSIHITPA